MRFSWTVLAAGAVALVTAAGCGQSSASAPGGGSGTARELHVTIAGKTTTEWYVKDGPWSASPEDGFSAVYDGNEDVLQTPATYRVVKGDPGYVRAAALPFVEFAPGVAIMHAYDAGSLSSDSRSKAKVVKGSDGSVTISVPIESESDTSSTTLDYRVVADPPVSLASARSSGAFAIPSGTPNETVTASAPGSASIIGMPAYWFGPKLQNRTARVSVQTLKTTSQSDDLGNDREYTTIYRTASIPSKGTMHGFAAYPGLGDVTTGDVYVQNLLNTERTEIAPGMNDTGRTAGPVTLGDGEHATLYTWDDAAISPGAGSFVIRTGKVTVEANYIGQLSIETIHQLVAQLRRVG